MNQVIIQMCYDPVCNGVTLLPLSPVCDVATFVTSLSSNGTKQTKKLEKTSI